jgi:hypothetical protein
MKMKNILLCLFIVIFVSGCEDSNIKKAKHNLANKMKDPSSVQWKDIRKIDENLVCGEYNAKNSYGAYIGFKKFASLRDLLILDDEQAIIIAGCDGEESSKKEMDKITHKLNEKSKAKKLLEKNNEIIDEAHSLVKLRLLSPESSRFSFDNVYVDNAVCGYFYVKGESVHGDYIVDGEKNVYLYHMNSNYKGLSTGYSGETAKNISELKRKYCNQ